MLPWLLALGTAALLQAQPALGMRAFVTGAPACSAKHCFGIVAHVVVIGEEPVQTPAWFARQVAEANGLFANIDVGFVVAEVRSAAAELADISSRSDRDGLGKGEHDPHVVHVWVVRRLADVDIEGDEIRGVHWRDRRDTTRRYVILSSIAPPRVLAHELGHFFGLPHSKYAVSIMNKTPRTDPPGPERGFHPKELAIMTRERDAMIADGTLKPRKRMRPRIGGRTP
ncbi:MAG TPA: matrixin family metalloprotease [Nannocystaceae bacterium]|nr:matrixin family metalloprotease [Nannocystaceae bacterium]